MNARLFLQFKEQNPNWERDYNIYKRDSEKFKRINCTWAEQIEGKPALNHEFHAVINTDNGDIYIDCRRRKIMAKHIVLAFARPIHTIVKTLWHLSIIGPLAIEIFALAKGEITAKKLGENTFKSLTDIVRTPCYGLAITLTHLAGIVLGCLSPNSLYYTREIAGSLEKKLLRSGSGDFYQKIWALAPCFSPIDNLAIAINHVNERREKSPDKQTDDPATFIAKQPILFFRSHRIFFNYCLLHPREQVYISSAKPL